MNLHQAIAWVAHLPQPMFWPEIGARVRRKLQSYSPSRREQHKASDRRGLPRALRASGFVDLARHDSDQSAEGRCWAYPRLWEALKPGGIFVSDDISNDMGFAEFRDTIAVDPIVVAGGSKFQGVIVRLWVSVSNKLSWSSQRRPERGRMWASLEFTHVLARTVLTKGAYRESGTCRGQHRNHEVEILVPSRSVTLQRLPFRPKMSPLASGLSTRSSGEVLEAQWLVSPLDNHVCNSSKALSRSSKQFSAQIFICRPGAGSCLLRTREYAVLQPSLPFLPATKIMA